ncbi:MAG: 1-acyl-sn-glycerol-3-phosphate acyltransferase [Clostridia bacterium]|nr:1-acyl-sn-glycerol-3-phosphate acyltransferase [Clostridia bacterium]
MKEKKKKPEKLEKVFKHLHFFEKVLYRVFFPYKIHGNLTKYNDGPLIMIGNHYSMLDVVFPILITDRPVHFIAKAELWKGGLMKKFVQTCGCIPANRDGTDIQAVKDSMRILKAGGVINIFPEGMRNKSYSEFLPFHGGAAALSIKTQTPIVPFVSITKIKPFKKTHVVYGDPIEFRQYYGKKITKEQLEKCDEILREAMWNMRLAFLERNKIKLKRSKV